MTAENHGRPPQIDYIDVLIRLTAAARARPGPGPAEPADRPDPDNVDSTPAAEALAALTALRQIRADLEVWEPALITAARQTGASWAQLAEALGVASRQAAERRYLRLRQSRHDQPDTTGDQRVQAERDRRAGDRAVTAWARSHGADLRQLAGQITALTDLGPAAQASVDRLHQALGGNDPAVLMPLLADTYSHLPAAHSALAERITSVTGQAERLRRSTQDQRARDRASDGGADPQAPA